MLLNGKHNVTSAQQTQIRGKKGSKWGTIEMVKSPLKTGNILPQSPARSTTHRLDTVRCSGGPKVQYALQGVISALCHPLENV